MTLSIQIAKFKFRQYQLRAVSPNLMLAKVTRYTVHFHHGNASATQWFVGEIIYSIHLYTLQG